MKLHGTKNLWTLVCTLLVLALTPCAFASTPIPSITVDSDGVLYTAPSANPDAGHSLLLDLAAELSMAPEDVLIALQFYMENEKNVVFVANPNISYFNSLIGVAIEDSGLSDLLAAVDLGTPLPATTLAFYLTSVRSAVDTLSLQAYEAKDVRCGPCGPGEESTVFCAQQGNECMAGCGTSAGMCYEVEDKLSALKAYFDQYGF